MSNKPIDVTPYAIALAVVGIMVAGLVSMFGDLLLALFYS